MTSRGRWVTEARKGDVVVLDHEMFGGLVEVEVLKLRDGKVRLAVRAPRGIQLRREQGVTDSDPVGG